MTTETEEIAHTVACWLSYKSLTGMRGLLRESSMGLPIAEYLSAKYGKEIESEKSHPLFPNVRGRPKQIDFVRTKRNEKSWHAAFECKFRTSSFPSVVNDLCRLACLSQADGIGRPNRYFIFARPMGKDASDDTELLVGNFKAGGQRIKAFDGIVLQGKSKLEKRHAIRLNSLHDKQRSAFRNFAKEYKVSLPSTIVTTLCGWSIVSEYACAIWQVKSENGVGLLSAQDIE